MRKTVTVKWRHVSPGLSYSGQHLRFSVTAESEAHALAATECIQNAWIRNEGLLKLNQSVEQVADEVASEVSDVPGLLYFAIGADHDSSFTYYTSDFFNLLKHKEE